MILQENYTLANGVEIPKLGLGTWMISDDTVAEAVSQAVALGYRHIDTAQAYANEAGVGDGVRACGAPRDELFITTKLAAEVKSYAEAVESIDGSLRTLGLDHVEDVAVEDEDLSSESVGAHSRSGGNASGM